MVKGTGSGNIFLTMAFYGDVFHSKAGSRLLKTCYKCSLFKVLLGTEKPEPLAAH